jgi:hypothetical protein
VRKIPARMSQTGHSRRFDDVRVMSAYHPIASKKADIEPHGVRPFRILVWARGSAMSVILVVIGGKADVARTSGFG